MAKRWHPLGRRLERGAAWVTAALALCAAVLGLVGPRLGGPDAGLPGLVGFVIELVAAGWFLGGVLAALVALVAAVRRLWWPAAALAAVALGILLPELWAWSQAPGARPPGDRRALRVAAVNLCGEVGEDPSMETCVRQLDADVLVLVEFTSRWARQLEGAFAGDYPHRWLAAAPDEPGLNLEGLRIAVWSRLPPAGDPEVRLFDRFNAQIRVPLRWQDHVVALYGIHPWKLSWGTRAHAWRDQRQLLAWLRDERLPMVVAGDFNAAPRGALLHRLRRLGLANASETVCGVAPGTWPMPPDLRAPLRVAIDHVMHSGVFTAVGFRTGMTTQSDHAPVVAELVWRAE